MQKLKHLFILFLCLFLTNCGDNDNIIAVKIELKDHKFTPDVIEVEAGKKITLEVHNLDSTIEEFESVDLHREKLVPPNSSVKITLAPLDPGTYNFFGDFNQDSAQGKIIVK